MRFNGDEHGQPQEIAPGLTMQWLYSRRIVALTLTDSRPEIIDAYTALNIQVIQQWPRSRPYLIFQDHTKVGFPEHLRQRAPEILSAFREEGLTGRNAFIARRQAPIATLRDFGDAMARRARISIRVFTSPPLALEWLKQVMKSP